MKPSDKELLEKYGIIFDTLKEDVSDMVISESDARLVKELDFAKNLEFTPRYQSLTQLRKISGTPKEAADKPKTNGRKACKSDKNGKNDKNEKDGKNAKSAEKTSAARRKKPKKAETLPPEETARTDGAVKSESDSLDIVIASARNDGHFADDSAQRKVKSGKIAERLAEKYAAVGFEGFSKDEVLEFILCKVVDDDRIEETVQNLMDKFGTLENVLSADASDLMIAGIEANAAQAITQHRELQRYLSTHRPMNVCLSNTEIAGRFCCERFGGDVVESFYVISLDAMRNVKACTLISRGIEHRTEAYPISILRAAMGHRASAVLLCHNHPGGNLRPSNEDIKTTQDIISVLNKINIPMIDHIICTKDRYLSMFDQYQLNF